MEAVNELGGPDKEPAAATYGVSTARIMSLGVEGVLGKIYQKETQTHRHTERI